MRWHAGSIPEISVQIESTAFAATQGWATAAAGKALDWLVDDDRALGPAVHATQIDDIDQPNGETPRWRLSATFNVVADDWLACFAAADNAFRQATARAGLGSESGILTGVELITD